MRHAVVKLSSQYQPKIAVVVTVSRTNGNASEYKHDRKSFIPKPQNAYFLVTSNKQFNIIYTSVDLDTIN